MSQSPDNASSGMPAAIEPCTPVLKWPGGKRWLAPTLAHALGADLRGRYYEPFLGGAAVYLRLQPVSAVLSDINAELVDFYNALAADPEALLRAVHRFSNTRICYYRVRSSEPRSAIGRAARFLYLNKTAWGGIYRLNRDGAFNVPFGNSDRAICSGKVVRAVARLFASASVVAADFEAQMSYTTKGDVIYADPPYTTLGQNNGFVRYNEQLFSWSDQQRLARAARAAKGRGAFVAVSGLWHHDMLGLYRGWWALQAVRPSLVSRQPRARRRVAEVVFFSRKPQLPEAARNWTLIHL